jgi:CheY-like chemotaxis protein
LLLRLSGHETHAVYEPIEAVKAASTLRPDVLLLDIGLPKVNGYEVCRQIRAEPWAKSVIMVALTGWGQDEDRRKSREAGFDHHMTKPVDYRRLMHVLGSSTLASGTSP